MLRAFEVDIQLDGSDSDTVVGVGLGLMVGTEGVSGCDTAAGLELVQMNGIDVGLELGWVAGSDVGSSVCY